MKDNKMIAEFMQLPTEIFQPRGIINYGRDDSWYEEHELSYHLSWSWLMDVVDKIECTPIDNDDNSDNFFNVMIEVFECNINGGDICICENGHTKREATYKAVVKFINQLNK